MRDSDAYDAQAAKCRADADTADLANVRERCLRAAAAWTAMAARSRRTESARDARAGQPQLMAAAGLGQARPASRSDD